MKKLFVPAIILFMCLLPAVTAQADHSKPDLGVWSVGAKTMVSTSTGFVSITRPIHIPRRDIDSISAGNIYFRYKKQPVYCPVGAFVDHPVFTVWWDDAVKKAVKDRDLDLFRLVEKITWTWNDPVITAFLVERIRDMADGIFEGQKSLAERTEYIFKLYAMQVCRGYGYTLQ